ncbi:MAG: OmpA family protein [bacterium]
MISDLNAQNQGDLKETLFGETDRLLATVQSEQANLFSPTNYKNAMSKYYEASKDFQRGKNLNTIQGKLSEVRTYLNKCLQIAKRGSVTFGTTIKAREDALRANAPEYAKNLYNKAESEFISAAKKLERNDVKGAKKRLPQIDDLYRQAELNAIKVSIIGNVRNLMREAKEIEANKYTPITYANALKLLNESEAILNSNRRSESSAKEKAEKAEFEAKHAIFLTRQIKRLKKNEREWENFILDREVIIEDIAKELGFEAYFDEGMQKPLNGILKIAASLQLEKRELLSEVKEKDAEIQRLNQELQSYHEKEQGLQAELREKQYKLEMKRRREERIKSVEEMFASREAVVLRKGNDLIIRLIGLTFPSGKATIRPEFFSLLTTVQRAIRKFPNAPFSIEGHTDSVGDDRYNENLSYERAQAVKQYLLANMGLDESRVTALGYGESRPIASNETNRGRAQNRRIDIVVTFKQESL